MLRVELESDRLRFNQQGSLIAHSDSEIEISILCFTQPPRPPKLSPCSECGDFQIESGQRFFFTPNPILFRENEGYLELTIRNTEGEVWRHRINIEPPLIA
ncbi:hypothetical protein BFP71_12180 [Roseivirga misakiensis]|uniref:Uncharacterized protein n=1 Tax=Roseivirga misakiensis TaxID=1563681 RepID=A0A1E5SYP5_9BACT|nr:hypothetical protein BFP71_12180 [Roseivirga misakiensis]